MYTLTHEDQEALTALLVGHKICRIGEGFYRLDDRTELRFVGNKGPLARPWGTYTLMARHRAMGDEMLMPYPASGFECGPIAGLLFRNDPHGEQHPDGAGTYSVTAETPDNLSKLWRLAWFLGTDGDGNYGTGYTVQVTSRVKE